MLVFGRRPRARCAALRCTTGTSDLSLFCITTTTKPIPNPHHTAAIPRPHPRPVHSTPCPPAARYRCWCRCRRRRPQPASQDPGQSPSPGKPTPASANDRRPASSDGWHFVLPRCNSVLTVRVQRPGSGPWTAAAASSQQGEAQHPGIGCHARHPTRAPAPAPPARC